MNKRSILIGGSSRRIEEKRKPVTAAELRRVMGQTGARLDPYGVTLTAAPPSTFAPPTTLDS